MYACVCVCKFMLVLFARWLTCLVAWFVRLFYILAPFTIKWAFVRLYVYFHSMPIGWAQHTYRMARVKVKVEFALLWRATMLVCMCVPSFMYVCVFPAAAATFSWIFFVRFLYSDCFSKQTTKTEVAMTTEEYAHHQKQHQQQQHQQWHNNRRFCHTKK